MPTAPLTNFVWANLARLMGTDDPSIDAVKRRTKVGRGTIQRIKEGGNMELNSLAQLARDFRVHPWQLLAPPATSGPAATDATEPAPRYTVHTDDELVACTQELLTRVPPAMRNAFADVLAGWCRDGGDDLRRAALLALLKQPPTKLPLLA